MENSLSPPPQEVELHPEGVKRHLKYFKEKNDKIYQLL